MMQKDGSIDIISELRKLEQTGVLVTQTQTTKMNREPLNDYYKNLSQKKEYQNADNSFNNTSMHLNNKFLKIMDEISDACIILDDMFSITYANQTTENIFNRTKKEVINSSLEQLFEEQKVSYIKEQCMNVLFEKKETTFELILSNNHIDITYNFILQPFSTGIIILIQKNNNIFHKDDELENTNKYKDIFELSPEGIITINKRAVVTDCNPAFMDLTGFSKEEIVGKTALTIPTLPLSTKFQMTRLLQSFLRGDISKDPIAFDWKRKDGTLRKGNAIIGLLKKNGKVQGIQAILRDTTEELIAEQKIKESQERFKALFNNSLELVYIHDFKGNFIDANATCFKALGYTQDEIKNLNFQSFLDKGQLLKALNTIKKVKKQGSQPMPTEFKLRCKDGSYIDIETTSSLIFHKGKPFAIQGVARDITERKKAEEELKKTHEQLKELNKNLENIVEKRTEQIQLLLKQKDDFINQLGHDLKNPLGPLLNLIPILEKKEEDSQKKELLIVVNRNVQYMKNLVNKTIQLAQLKSPTTTLQFETFNLKDEIDDIITNNQLLFQDNHLEIQNELPDDITINADKLRIQEVFNNILNNAVKYREGSSGHVLIQKSSSDDNTITISISDKGIGMTKEQLDNVFNEFYKADSSRHDFDSSGLGMSICKRIIEMHDGKIWVESNGLGKGSTFSFTLPAHREK